MALVISRSDVAAVISMEDVIETVASAHAEHARGRVEMPNRFAVHLPGSDGEILPMAAAMPTLGAVGIKLLSIFPGNRAASLPVLDATILLVDPETGFCEAVVDGGLLTAFRTASASAVATRYLARDDAHVLGLVGLGVEGRSHLDAIRMVREIDRVVGWTRSAETVERFRQHVGDEIEFELLDSPEAVTRSCDVLCTLTAARTPIVLGEWFSPGLHVNAVGSHDADARELDTAAVARSRVVVDILASVLDQCGDLNLPVGEGAIASEHFSAELGGLVNGDVPARRDDQEITLYKSVGVGIQDIATAHLIYTRAREAGLGIEVALR